MLAPWPYHMERRKITRQQCLALNAMSYAISTEPWTRQLEQYVATLPVASPDANGDGLR